MWQKVALLILACAGGLYAQNPNPCRQVQNSAVAGQVLSAVSSGNTPPCQWITGGGGGGGVSQVTGTLPIQVANTTTTPVVSCRTATGSVSGCLTAADWTTFNSKQAAGSYVVTTRTINTTAPLAGGGDLSADRTFTCNAASGSQPGCLSAADWTTFNGKQAGGSYITALTGEVTASGPGSVAATIANNAVTTVKILDANVTAAKMVNAGVFTGDVTTTFPAITVAKVNGIAYSATGAAHSVPVITTANTTATYKAVPDCTDTGGNHLNFTQSSDAFSCGTSGGGGGSFVLVEQHTASNSATLDFTTCISSTYDDYMIDAVSLVPNTNSAEVQLLVSTDGGMNYATTGYQTSLLATQLASNTNVNVNTSTSIWFSNNFGTGVTRAALSGTIRMYKPGDATLDKIFTIHSSGTNSNGVWFVYTGGAIYDSASAINAFQVKPSSGNLTFGTVRCYGIAK